ncbi:MAG: AAA family ATPase, partial [Anaerolineae bacterium]|nr:AAA family ATPase [Anaerolineae bacterium]
MATMQPLEARQLRQTCDHSQFDFETTAELEDLGEIVGQERAVSAIQFGISIQREGYNLFALGPSGTGKRTTIRQFLDQRATTEPIPSDWCYVNNFEQPHRPRALRFPPGRGIVLRKDIEQLVEELRTAIPSAFESEDYRTRKQEAEEEFKEQQEKAFGEIQQQAQEGDIALIRTPVGLAFAPLREGEVINPDEFQKLPEEKRKQVETDISILQEQLQAIMYQVRQWEREAREKVKELDRQVAMSVVGHPVDELRKKYVELPDAVDYLNEVQQDVIENVDEFRKTEEAPQIMGIPLPRSLMGPPAFR